MPVELHCHSLFSVDGWVTPEELAEAKAEKGFRVLALTDHNCIAGLERCRTRTEALGVRFIDGCEFDAIRGGVEYHFVAFGFDPTHEGLRALCRRQFAQYAVNFARIMPVLEKRYGITEQDLVKRLPQRYRTHPAPVLNKWFARTVLQEKADLPDMKIATEKMSAVVGEAEREVERPWDWANLEEVRDTVHEAGGILLVAHPAGHARDNFPAQKAFIESLLKEGLDGFELYHPSCMIEPHFEKLVDLAKQLGCAVSGGSDSHRDGASSQGFTVPDWVIETIDGALKNRQA